MSDPKVIFGDEPTGALNSTSANEIMGLLGEIHRAGTTIVLVTHDAKVAARTERVLFMLDGRIAGEFLPGAYDEADDLKAREEALTSWLAAMKFWSREIRSSLIFVACVICGSCLSPLDALKSTGIIVRTFGSIGWI